MSVKAFKYYSIQAGGTPQPVIGTYLTAAVTQNQINAANPQGGLLQNLLTLTVADSTMFTGAAYADVVDPTTYFTERVRVVNVPSGTTVQVQGLQKPHPGGIYGTGSWVALGDFAQNLYIQAVAGNTGTLYIGTTAQMATTSGVGVIVSLVKGERRRAALRIFNLAAGAGERRDAEPVLD